jgi:hypothetical protein
MRFLRKGIRNNALRQAQGKNEEVLETLYFELKTTSKKASQRRQKNIITRMNPIN